MKFANGLNPMSMWSEFLNEQRSYTIAPAGYGKTHAIVDCVEELALQTNLPILILTHTHAGVASIKQKLANRRIDKDLCQIETITSFAQRYVLSFLLDTTILPEQSDVAYFDCVLTHALPILESSSVQKVIRRSYGQLIVDEYQDCSYVQHQIICLLSCVIPTHIFGDPLQGIFGFKGDRMVNMEIDLGSFRRFELLDTPWRWKVNGNSAELGTKISSLRSSLIDEGCATLVNDSKSNFWVRRTINEMLDMKDDYFAFLRKVIEYLNSTSLLIIVPMYYDNRGIHRGLINDRVILQSRVDFRQEFTLVEAIDDHSFYKQASAIDELQTTILRARKKVTKIQTVLNGFEFRSGDINQWFGDNTVKNRRGDNQPASRRLSHLVNEYTASPSLSKFQNILDFFTKELHYHSKRPDLLHSLAYCCNEASLTGITVLQCMHDLKNKIRRSGRKIEGKCIGTTLLTKGIEFDDVIILDAHRFSDRNNFYVAVSRACKRLVILTKAEQLSFNLE